MSFFKFYIIWPPMIVARISRSLSSLKHRNLWRIHLDAIMSRSAIDQHDAWLQPAQGRNLI